MPQKSCMNCGTSGCDHKDARRCAGSINRSLWTPDAAQRLRSDAARYQWLRDSPASNALAQADAAGGLSDLTDVLAIAIAALKRIAECADAPDIDATGEWQLGLHCGVEDRDCRDRYDGADYGHTVGVEKGLEWASNEAKYALEQMANAGVSGAAHKY